MDRREFTIAAGGLLGSMALAPRMFAGTAIDLVQVRVDSEHTLGMLPVFGLGFSMEKNLIGLGDFFLSANTDFAGCCRRLGQQVLRIGGNHVDLTSWDAKGRGGEDGKTSPKDIVAFADFVKSVGWKVIYGLNLAKGQPETTAAEGNAAADALGDALLAFEIGNEPDLYVFHGLRPPGYDYAAFIAEWMPHAKALRAAVPHAPLCGPGTFNAWRKFALPFAQELRGSIAMLTQHYYRANGKKPGATADALLDGLPGLFDEMQALEDAAKANGIGGGFRMVETNTFMGGGSPGVSDSMVSALWAVQYVLRAAELGVNGLNFQIGPKGHSNTSIAIAAGGVVTVRPEFYGLAMLAALGTGTMLRVEAKGISTRQGAFAVRHAEGGLSVVLNNMTDQPMAVQVALDRPAPKAQTCLLTAPSLLALGGVTLGGTAIATDGKGKPAWHALLAASPGTFEVAVPAASAIHLKTI